ncbi:MAG: RES family NAD+ phosphorylase [Chitinophagaceae bacterium]
MIVYRLSKTKWSKSLDGEGSRLFGGRWNDEGIPCVYTSESRALAVLEYTVNTNVEDIPRLLSMVAIEIPDSFLDNPVASLPGDWQEAPASGSTKEYGSRLLKKKSHGILRFPSAVIPKEFNYLLNPLHAVSESFKIIEVQDFVYDVRIKMA